MAEKGAWTNAVIGSTIELWHCVIPYKAIFSLLYCFCETPSDDFQNNTGGWFGQKINYQHVFESLLQKFNATLFQNKSTSKNQNI
ncbi:MAG: hypothetical protein PUF46_05950 [Oscillospiraceae bacterium]|nr:hypothetical protein [Oscillospiraceae bacterium]